MFKTFVSWLKSRRGESTQPSPWFNPPGSPAFYGKGVIIAPAPIKYDLYIPGQPTQQFNSLKEAMEAADSLDAPAIERERRKVG